MTVYVCFGCSLFLRTVRKWVHRAYKFVYSSSAGRVLNYNRKSFQGDPVRYITQFYSAYYINARYEVFIRHRIICHRSCISDKTKIYLNA